MKKLFFSIFFLAVGIITTAQENFVQQLNGWVLSDSLKTGDSTVVYDLGYAREFASIISIDTTASVTDSVKVYGGFVRAYSSGAPMDTVWTSNPLNVKDQDWVLHTVIAKPNETEWFMIQKPFLRLIKLDFVNANDAGAGTWKYIVEVK